MGLLLHFILNVLLQPASEDPRAAKSIHLTGTFLRKLGISPGSAALSPLPSLTPKDLPNPPPAFHSFFSKMRWGVAMQMLPK